MGDPSPTDLADLAARLDALETRVAYQDQVIEDLNKVVLEQWTQIDHAQRQIAVLSERVTDLQDRSPGGAPEDEPPPPHY